MQLKIMKRLIIPAFQLSLLALTLIPHPISRRKRLKSFFASIFQLNALEDLNHLYYFAIAIFFLLVHFSLPDELVPQKVNDDLFLNIGAPSEIVLLRRGRICRRRLALRTAVTRQTSIGRVEFIALILEMSTTIHRKLCRFRPWKLESHLTALNHGLLTTLCLYIFNLF